VGFKITQKWWWDWVFLSARYS